MVFHWILSDSKSSNISWNSVTILTNLNNAVVWMDSTRALIFRVFLHQYYLVVFHWGLSDSKSPQVYRILLSIPIDFSNVVFWVVSTRSPISSSSSSFNNPLGTFPTDSITFGFTVTLMFHRFLLLFQSPSIYPYH